MFDLLLKGGWVHDGAGAPARRADVAVSGDRIAAVGELADAAAREVVEVAGGWVCPGFVDVHSHSDAYLLIEPSAPSKVFQGVTTEIVGNCGASAAPLAGAARMPSDWQSFSYPGAWSSVADYRRLLGQVCPAPNVAMLIGHNTLRAGVLGYEARPARADEVAAMERALDRALDEGGCGFSTGLIYAPGRFAAADELQALARVAARRGTIYTSHMRSEGRELLEALDETLAIGRAAGVRVQVSHLKTSGPENWPKLDAALEKLRAARVSGIEVAADRYPYTASCTDLDVLLPAWAAAGGREEILGRLRDPDTRRRLHAEIAASRSPDDWRRVLVGSTWHPDQTAFAGRPLTDVAVALGTDPADAALTLIERDALRTGGIFFGMNEDNLWRILAEPWVMIGSDGSLRSPEGPLSHDFPHPRTYGAFARFLRAALDGRTVAPPEAIRKMTGLPARQFRLHKRGEIRPGWFADLVWLDPATVRDEADYAHPHRLASGIRGVWVNGIATLRDARFTGRRGGRFLEPA